MTINYKIKSLSLAALFLVTPMTYAGWQLDNEQSHINFVSVKKSKIGEVHYFKQLSGSLKDNGTANISIDLNSVETNIGIRNERMLKMLFETKLFPAAQINGKFDVDKIRRMKVGSSFDTSQNLSLGLHGQKQDMMANVKVIKLSNQKILVTSLQPLILNAGDFKLINGVEKLREIAGLPSISTAVPITFTLTFNLETR